MSTKSERGINAKPKLPEGMILDDLRFVHPQLYALSVVQLGWEALIGSGIDGNPAKVAYTLSRPVSEGINLDRLRRSTGIIDEEGTSLPGYTVGVVEKDGKHILGFNFTGFPTQQTMDVLKALEDEFNPEGVKPIRLRLLASSEPMDDFDDYAEAPRRKSLLERARTIFNR